jgi:drug/metabolite transporter (DMT)-like permease
MTTSTGPILRSRCLAGSKRLDPVTTASLIMTILAWASAFPAIRAGLAAFGPLELGALRFAVAAVPAALYLLIARPPLPRLHEAWRFGVGGLFFVALYTALLNLGEVSISAGAASFIINTNPIITAILATAILGETFSRQAWLGTALSFAGIALIALGEQQGAGPDGGSVRGALLILGAALCTSINSVAQKPLFSRHNPLTVSAWNLVLGSLLLAPALPGAFVQAMDAPREGLIAVLYLGIVPSLVAYATWSVVLSRLPASRASNFMYCVPPVALMISFVWLGEMPTALGMVGGLLALAGVAVVNIRR